MQIDKKSYEIVLNITGDNTDYELKEIKHLSTKTVRLGEIRTNPKLVKVGNYDYTSHDVRGGYDLNLHYVCDDDVLTDDSQFRLLPSDLILHAHTVIEQ
jgi:hypothetical protein